MIRLFHHYVNRHVVLQMLFDFGFVWLAMLAIAIAHVKNPEVFVSLTTTHGLSLATGTFLINIWSGFYQTSPSRPLHQSVARAALALMLVTPLAYWIFSLVPVESADLMAYSAMSVVLVVIVHRVYAAHSGWHTMARTRILVLGAGPVAQRVSDTLRASDRYTEIVGYFPSPTSVSEGCPIGDHKEHEVPGRDRGERGRRRNSRCNHRASGRQHVAARPSGMQDTRHSRFRHFNPFREDTGSDRPRLRQRELVDLRRRFQPGRRPHCDEAHLRCAVRAGSADRLRTDHVGHDAAHCDR